MNGKEKAGNTFQDCYLVMKGIPIMLLSLLPRQTAFYLNYCHVGLVFKSLRLYHALILVSFRKLRCTHLITRPLQYSAFRSTSSSFSSPSSLSTFLLRRQVFCGFSFCFLEEAYGTEVAGVGYSYKHSTERLHDAMFCKEFCEPLHYGLQVMPQYNERTP